MTINERMEQIKAIRNGSFANISYHTDCSSKIKASAKSEVSSIWKYTNRNCMIGVDYGNIKRVQRLKELGIIGELSSEYNWEWLDGLKEKIATNKKTGTTALRIVDIDNGCKSKVEYMVVKADGTRVMTDKEGLRPYMQNSFYAPLKTGSKPPCNWIKLENIEMLNGK